ncbi:hypothetical protein BW730_07465 [Tessaracoccus aquimaris]|uniref:Peptidoglycan binding-like domain-containing protein n=1 Tax=Tessaracoccus aquimaris TaxID=1332264 RepID=A0A1Q2CML2_9ACTN|nr:hypothetical protein BW730_07465 [Tessaracoccus aquimaris]
MTARVRFPSLVLSWSAVAAVSVGVVWFSAFRPIDEPTLGDAGESFYALARSEFADERPVEVSVAPAPGRPLIVRESGILTTVDCAVGDYWASGSSPVAVGGAGLLLLSGQEPWYRDLTAGDEGEDVANLQRALNHLGAEIPVSGRFDTLTQDAWKKTATKAQVPAKDGVFRLSQVVWLPENEVIITQCPLSAGQDIAAGAVIGTASSGHATVSLAAPADLFDGPRTLTVAATTVKLDKDLRLADPEDARAVLATAEVTAAIAQGTGESVQVSGALRLATPIPVYAVPPSSVVRDASARVCVLSAGSPIAAEVISSALGLTYVRLVGDPPPAVDVYPAMDATCGS